MSRGVLAVAIPLAVVAIGVSHGVAERTPLRPPESDPDYEMALDELFALDLLPDRTAEVEQLTLSRDAATLTFERGTLHLLTPVAGRIVGAVFVGEGHVRIVPPLAIERAQVRRVFKNDSDTLTRRFVSVVLVFGDSTAQELERRLPFGPGTASREARRQVREALAYLGDRKRRTFHRDVLVTVLNLWQNALFYAHLGTERDGPLFFVIDPYDDHETITVGRRARHVSGDVMEAVSKFPSGFELERTVRLEPRLIAVDHYQVDTEIRDGGDCRGRTTISFHALRPGVQWIPLRLYQDLKVDSVVGLDGAPLPFARPDESRVFWIRAPHPLEAGEAETVVIRYGGRLLEQRSLLSLSVGERSRLGPTYDRWVFLRDPNEWYPNYRWEAAPMDLVFRTHPRYVLATVGESTGVERDGRMTTSYWRAEAPIRASFMIGEFVGRSVDDPRIAPVTVLVDERAHADLEEFFARNDMPLLAQRNKLENVAADVANSLAFFGNQFGESTPRRFFAAEIPYFHGQAFPGLLHLSWATFQSTDDQGTNELFRAHEMAHQWWGIDVEPASYRDQWLAEGLAEFSGLWYMQLILGDNEKYFRFLRDWRDDLHRRRKEIGPTCIGARASVGGDPEDYQLAIYTKGAWITHMLRNLFLDLNTMSEGAFVAMMRDFYQTYRGRKASSEDFQRVVERHAGAPMDWFFDQWLCGSAVPTYRYRHTVDEQPDGSFTLRLRIRQEDTPDGFKMLVPLHLDFGEVGTAMVRLLVEGKEKDFTLAQLPARPRRVELNPFESVLAKVVDDGRLR